MPIDPVCPVLLHCSSFSDGRSQVLEYLYRGIPVYACICDTDTLLQTGWALGWYLLTSLVQMGLDHDTDDAVFAFSQLLRNRFGDLGLIAVVLLRVSWNRVSDRRKLKHSHDSPCEQSIIMTSF